MDKVLTLLENQNKEAQKTSEGSARIHYPLDPASFDPDAVKIIRRLTKHGFEAYFVGGCVRDLLLGETPKDFDIATSALPQEIRKLFRNCRIIGRRFQLAHIYFSNQNIIEVATFRAGAKGRSGKEKDLLIIEDNVFGNARSDALRRDFSLNALFYDMDKNEIIDFAGGLKHANERKLVAIGDPWVRFREDPVRIIRAAKYAAKLNLKMDENTWQAMKDCHEEIIKSSPARVVEEIFKILSGKRSGKIFSNLETIGLLKFVLPSIALDFEKSSEERKKEYWNYLFALEYGLTRELPVEFQKRKIKPPFPPQLLEKPSRAILFSTLFVPIFQRELEQIQKGLAGHGLRDYLYDRIQEMGTFIRNPRKDTYRSQQIVTLQDRLFKTPKEISNPHSKKTRYRKRNSPSKIASRPYFLESLQFMWLCGAANENFSQWAAYEFWARWQNRVSQGEVESSPPHPRRGRRRRRRRRRRNP